MVKKVSLTSDQLLWPNIRLNLTIILNLNDFAIYPKINHLLPI